MTANFVPSNQARYLRACMVCSIVQTQQRFIRDGCPNCEAFLDLTNHPDSVQECTSQVFEGLITLADPGQSWVAKWQRLDGYVAGVYAVKVVGSVSGLPTSGVRRLLRWSGVCDGSYGRGFVENK